MTFIRKHIAMFLLAVLVVAILLTSTIAYQVEFTDKALIKRFGRTQRVIDGFTNAGLKWKFPWPIERLEKYDSRSHVFEDTHSEIQTRDKKNLLVTLYCAWRVDDAAKFHKRIKLVEEAQERIRTLLRNAKKEVITQHNMGDLINTDPKAVKITDIEARIQNKVALKAREDYGVEIGVVGVKRLGLPESVSAGVIDSMKEERQRYVKLYEGEGQAIATAIRGRAKSAADRVIAFANRKAQNIRSEGDRAAAEYYSKFEQNPGLSMYLRSLESLKKELSSKTVFLLDGSEIPAVGYFHKGPSIPKIEPAAVPGSKQNQGNK